MARGHEILIAADTRDFEHGIRDGVIDPLTDADKELDKLKTAGADAGRGLDKLGDAARDLGRDGARGADKLTDALRDAQRQSERTGASVADVGDKSMHKLGEASAEVRQEWGQNMGEAVSSFRGDMSDLGQIGQDTLGGLAGTVAGMGPGGLAGAFALAAGAAGLGLLTQGITDAKQREEEAAQAAADWAAKFIEAGQTIMSGADIVGGVIDIATDPKQYQDAKKNAEDWGVSVGTAMRAMAGDSTSLAVVGSKVDALRDAWNEDAAAAHARADQSHETTKRILDEGAAYSEARDSYTKLADARSGAIQTMNDVSEALRGVVDSATDATVQTDQLGNKLVTLPDGKQIVINAKTGQATDNVKAFHGDVDKLPTTHVTDVRAVVSAIDDSIIRNYQPRVIKIPGMVMINGRQASLQ